MELPDPDRWTKIKDILHEAESRPEGEWDAYLDEVCDGDEALRHAVEGLLDAASTYGPLIDAGAMKLVHAFDVGAPAEPDKKARSHPAEQTVGPYQLDECIGEGGSSIVYRARRVDDQFERTVAVKILRSPINIRGEAGERFRVERQILASLSHPHIADVYDGGVLDDGRPYLVMEYVDGRPITEHCEAEDVPIRSRVRLFGQAVDAVQAAHEQLVVHRDLKPSNVLVERDTGRVKLVDFGIAKILGELPGGRNVATQTGRHPMTPAYAAPEQVKGESITVATDTYSLGVLLYELLTGYRPYGDEAQSPYAIARSVCEEVPLQPSSVVDDEARQVALQGELDAIVRRALRKAPQERYDTADALKDDLSRYLRDRPVRAAEGSWTYRARKFVRRHRGVIAGTVMTLVLLAGFASYHGWRLSEERDRAEQEAETAEQVSEFLVGLFEASNPAGETPETVTARALLQAGQQRVDRLHGQPEVQARMFDAMGRAHMGLGHYDAADSLFQRALTLRRDIYESPHPAIAAGLDHRSRALDGMGRYAAADSLAHEALRMRREVRPVGHPDIAESMHHLALYKKRQGAYALAESLYSDALRLRRGSYTAPHADIAATLSDLAQLHTERGEYVVAESLNREALRMRRTVFDRQHPKTSESLNNLAQAVERQGRIAEAESLYRRTLAIDREVLGSTHPFVATDINNLAVTLEKQGQYAAAESLKRKSLALRRKTLGADHPDVTIAMNNLAVLLRKKGDYDKAADLFQRVLERNKTQVGEQHPYVAFTLGNLGDVRKEQERYATADSLYQASLEMLTTVLDENHPRVATAMENLADLREEQGQYAEAERWHSRALRIRRHTPGPNSRKVVESLISVGDLLMEQGQPDSAKSRYREALAMSEDGLPEEDWRRAYARTKLGRALVEQGAYEKAEPMLRSSYHQLRETLGENDDRTEAARRHLRQLYVGWDKLQEVRRIQ